MSGEYMVAALIGIVDQIPYARCSSLLKRISSGESASSAVASEGFVGSQRSMLLDAFSKPSAELEEPWCVAASLQLLYERLGQSAVSIAWTGPLLSGVAQVRSTFAVAKEIVGGARQRLIIAGYVAHAEVLERIGIRGAIKRGVDVIILLDRVDFTDVGIQTMQAAGANVFDASPVVRGMQKFHAKVILADDVDALVSSANFTFLGQTENVEIGVRIRGEASITLSNILTSYMDYISKRESLIKSVG